MSSTVVTHAKSFTTTTKSNVEVTPECGDLCIQDSPHTDYSSHEIPYGRRTIIGLIEQVARNDPFKVFGSYPTSSTAGAGFRDVTYRQLASAVDRGAWWFEQALGKSEANPTVAWTGPLDFRYMILPIAAAKAGYKLLLLSPKNTLEQQLHLIRRCKCTILLRDETAIESKRIIDAADDLKDVLAPILDDMLSSSDVVPYYWREDAAALARPFVILHSSGSTGMPKCILWTHKAFASLDAQHLLPDRDGFSALFPSLTPGNFLSLFPPFHAGGLLFAMCLAPFYGHRLIFPPLGQVNANMIIDILKKIKVDLIAAPPSVLEDLSQMTDVLPHLKTVKGVMFGGGPISGEKGGQLARYTKVWNVMGSTECGKFPIKHHDENDFNYIRFPTELKGLQFEEHGEDSGLYELYWVRDSETDNFHCSWTTYPELTEYHTKDLYRKHPTKPGLWKHCGRIDDVIVLSNGEKLVATPLEKIIEGSLIIKNALVIGHGRFETAVLIEAASSASTLSNPEFLAEIQPYIEKGNLSVSEFARLSPDMVLLTKPEKPMIRTGKGSVIRAQTTALYAQEIEELYSSDSTGNNSDHSTLLKSNSAAQTSETLTAIYREVLGKDSDLKKDDNVFSKGFDSLSAIRVTRKIRKALKAEGYPSDMFNPALLYSAPTTAQLAERLREIAGEDETSTGFSSDQDTMEEARLSDMQALMQKYCRSRLVVLLTGSTGFLGSYILDALIGSEMIQTIYVLNRAEDGGLSRHKDISQESKLSSDFSKVTFIHSDLSKSFLGLAEQDYLLLKSSVDIIIHNQWQVDFNLPLSSFEPHVAGVRNLLDMANDSAGNPCFLFISSVAAVARYKECKAVNTIDAAPEIVQHDPVIAMPSGYGMSKHISECLIDMETRQTGLRTAIIRLGQVAGPVIKLGGVWKKQEWLPSLILSSNHLKMVPNDIGEVDWIPADILADVLVEIATHEHRSRKTSVAQSTTYNIANPNFADWTKDVLPTLLQYLPKDARTVSLSEWVQVLKESARNIGDDTMQADVEANPATRLVSFYEDASMQTPIRMGARLEIQQVKKASRIIQNLEAVNDRWISTWAESWRLVQTA